MSTGRLLEVNRRTLSMPAALECYSELLIDSLWPCRECVLTTVDCTPLRGGGGRMLVCRRKGGAMKQVRAQREVTVVRAHAPIGRKLYYSQFDVGVWLCGCSDYGQKILCAARLFVCIIPS